MAKMVFDVVGETAQCFIWHRRPRSQYNESAATHPATAAQPHRDTTSVQVRITGCWGLRIYLYGRVSSGIQSNDPVEVWGRSPPEAEAFLSV